MKQENGGNPDGPLPNRALSPEETDHVADCPVCDSVHEWTLDRGAGGAVGVGWVSCPESRSPISIKQENAREKRSYDQMQES